jgi:hypothetical protein
MFWIPVRECARTLWMGAPFWGKGGRIPEVGTRSVSWTQIREERRSDKMRRRQEVKEDDPFMASRCQHAQSKLKVPKREIFDGVFFALIKPNQAIIYGSRAIFIVFKNSPIYSNFHSYAHAQHAHIVTTRMLSIIIVLLRVCSAYAYCYYTYAQYKHSNK